VLQRIRDLDPVARRWLFGGVAFFVLLVPLLFHGPGNDLDSGNTFASARAITRHFHYQASRPPGAPVHETATGLLDLIGGPTVTNLGSLLMAAVCGIALFTLLRRHGVRGPGLFAVGVVVLNPWFIIAATATADYVWALAFVLLAAHALRSDRPVLAGLLAACSMGCRIGSGLLIAAMLFAELFEGRPARRRVLTTVAVAMAGTVLLFVPAYHAVGSMKFAENNFSTSTPAVHLGRTAAKDLVLLGPLAWVVLLAAVPRLFGSLRSWNASWLVRFAATGLLLSQLLFLRFPWKVPHLLPCLLCLAILFGAAFDRRPALLYALVFSQLLYLAVRIDLVKPDDPNNASRAKAAVDVGWGPVVIDQRCRRELPRAYLGPQPLIERAWECARPFGG